MNVETLHTFDSYIVSLYDKYPVYLCGRQTMNGVGICKENDVAVTVHYATPKDRTQLIETDIKAKGGDSGGCLLHAVGNKYTLSGIVLGGNPGVNNFLLLSRKHCKGFA